MPDDLVFADSAGHTFIEVIDAERALMEQTAANDDVAPVATGQDLGVRADSRQQNGRPLGEDDLSAARRRNAAPVRLPTS